jgi:hypothetical protein
VDAVRGPVPTVRNRPLVGLGDYRVMTTVACECVATCSETLPCSTRSTAFCPRLPMTMVSPPSRAAFDHLRRVAAGLVEGRLHPGRAQDDVGSLELLGVHRRIVPRVDR